MTLREIFSGRPDIEKLQKRGDVEGLLRALSHKNTSIRSQAVVALGKIGDHRAIPSLITALKDTTLRSSAAQALAEIGLPAVESLLAALRDETTALRLGAIEALGSLGDKICEPIKMAKDPDIRLQLSVERNAKILKDNDERLLSSLVDALRDPDVNVRHKAVKALTLLGGPGALDPLAQALSQDSSIEVRKEVVLWLFKLCAGFLLYGVKELIVTAFNDKQQNDDVRYLAATVLAKLGAIDDLVEAARKRDIPRNFIALESLTIMGDQGIEKLIDLVKEGINTKDEWLSGISRAFLLDRVGPKGEKALRDRGFY